MVYIDYLRFLSIIAVIFFHLHENITYQSRYFAGGYVGVDVFLFLSGFLITRSLSRVRQGGLGAGSADFVKRRLARIMVPTIVITLLVAGFAVLSGIGTWRPALWSVAFGYNFYLVVRHIPYFQNDSMPHLFLGMWYLSLLVQLYLLHFLLRILFRRDRYFFAAIVVIAAIMLAGAVVLVLRGHANQAYVLPWHGFPYLFGSLYAGFEQRASDRASDRARAWRYDVLGLGAVLLLALIMVFGRYHDYVIYSAATAVLTGLVLFSAKRGRWLCSIKPSIGSVIGEMSFSLYLWNVPVIAVVHHFLYDAPPFDQLVLALLLIFALSLLTYQSIEVSLQRLVAKRPRVVLGVMPALVASVLLCFGAYGWYRAAAGQQQVARLAGQIDNLNAKSSYLTDQLRSTRAALAADQRAIAAHQARQAARTQAKIAAAQARRKSLLTWVPEPRKTYVYFDNRRIAQNPLYPDKKVLFLTDSILLGWSGYVLHEVPDGYLDGHVGRSFVRSIGIIAALKDQKFYHNIKYIVIELGSNGPVDRANLVQFLALVGQRQVLLIIPAVPRPWQSEVARQYRWAQAHDPNVHVLAWNRLSAGKVNYVVADQVHLTWFGVQPLMFAILRKLYALGYTTPPAYTAQAAQPSHAG
jgi:peptidoglycan/LPS O-acetylase OafA/YrhL